VSVRFLRCIRVVVSISLAYLTHIRSLELLSAEDECELARRWHDQRDSVARDALLEAHLRCVLPIASKYRREGVPLGELIAEGNVGLIRALDTFDPSRARFATYARYWIKAYVSDYVARTSRYVSLDARADDTGSSLLDSLATTDPDPEQAVAAKRRQRRFAANLPGAVAKLDARERHIVEHRLGADADTELSLAALADQLGVSRARVHQLEARVKRKLAAYFSELATA
jgi:RNA polymerase sigma factor (sigma-70 family)